jgi:hypothetical protein
MHRRDDITFGYPGYPDVSHLNATVAQPPFRDTYHVNQYLRILLDGNAPFENVALIDCGTSVFLNASGLFNRDMIHRDLIHPIPAGKNTDISSLSKNIPIVLGARFQRELRTS